MARKYSHNEFIELMKNTWKNQDGTPKYDYSITKYINMRTDIDYICPIHGKQTQLASTHKQLGCIECSGTRTLTKRKFIERCTKIHNGKYKYDKIEWYGLNTPKNVLIKCPIHDYITVDVQAHLKGCGCRFCAYEEKGNKQRKSINKFIEEGLIAHPNENLSFENVNYIDGNTFVNITCNNKDEFGNIHGDFPVLPRMFIRGAYRCPICFNKHKPFAETKILNILNNCNQKVQLKNRQKLSNNKELDFWLPDKNLAIEHNGLYWHSDKIIDKNYHLQKYIECETKNIHLIQIFEDELISKYSIIKDRIIHLLNKTNSTIKLGARNCKIYKLTENQEKDFLNKFDLTGYTKSDISYGLCYNYNGKLRNLCTISFCKIQNTNNWFLSKFCICYNLHIPGAFGKLLNYFIYQIKPDNIITLTDNSWISKNNNIFKKFGFKYVKIIEPDYKYVHDKLRLEKDDKSNLTKYYKIYDSGKTEWILNCKKYE